LRNVRRNWAGKVPESIPQFGVAIPRAKADNSFATKPDKSTCS